MPKFSPWKKYRKMARIDSAAEIGKLTRRKRMKSNLVSSGTMRRRRTAVSFVHVRGADRYALRADPAHPIGDDQAGHRERREQRRDDADAERHREAAHRPGADEEQHGGRDEGGDVGVENGGERTAESGVDRRDGAAAAAHLLADALVDQHVGIDRDAHREHDAGDAGQRQGRVEQRQDAEDHADIDRHRDIGEQAEQPVGHQHENDDQDRAHDRCVFALVDRVLPETGTDDALLDRGELGRQGAGPQQDREIIGGLHGEVTGNLPGAAEDGFADDRRGDYLVVEHDGEGTADIFLGDLGEFARTRGVEAEAHDRLAGALVEGRLRVGQVGALDDDLLVDQHRNLLLAFSFIEQFGIRRHATLHGLLRVHGLVDQPELELGGLADQFDQAPWIAEARHLHQDAIDALALDGGFDQAELVDPLFDDRDRLL